MGDYRVWLVVAALAVGCKGESKESQAPSEPAKKPLPATADTEPAIVPADDAAVAFFVTACNEAGLPAEQCTCAANEAKTALGAALASKMSKAPADDDPALTSYYTGGEINRIMAWVDGSAETCGIEVVQ